MARQLSDRRARQIVDEFDLRRQFVPAELAGKLRAQLVERERLCAGPELDEGLCGLAAIRVGNAEHDHLVHAWYGVDRLLDHLRIDVEAAGDDHVLLAVDQEEIAVAIDIADVAGEEAAVDEGLRGSFGLIPIAPDDVRALDADLADLARRQYACRIVQRDDVELDAGQHQADRARLVGTNRRMAGTGRAGLGHAPAAAELLADFALEETRDLHRQRRAPGADGG